MTAEILQLGDWLAAQGVTHVAMEAIGVYWQPIYTLLEDEFALQSLGVPTPYLSTMFPNRGEAYPEYLTLRDLPPAAAFWLIWKPYRQ